VHVRGAVVVQPVSVPCVALPFRTPLTYQFRAVLVVPLRVAVNTCVPPSARLLLVGLIVTTMVDVTVAVAVAEVILSAALTILNVTGFGFGQFTGGAV